MQARHIGDDMTAQKSGLIPKIIYLSVTCVFCSSIFTSLALFVLLGLGVVEMSDAAVGALASVMIALNGLMRVVAKLAGQGMLHGS